LRRLHFYWQRRRFLAAAVYDENDGKCNQCRRDQNCKNDSDDNEVGTLKIEKIRDGHHVI